MEAAAALAALAAAVWAGSADAATRVVHAMAALGLLSAWTLAAPSGRELARPRPFRP